MRQFIVHNAQLLSIKTNNIKSFLFDNLSSLFSNSSYIYVFVSHKNYNIDFNINCLIKVKQYDSERFLFEVDKNLSYIENINDLHSFFIEFQNWQLYIGNFKINNYDLYEHSLISIKNTGLLFYKGIEEDVVWLSAANIDSTIEKLT